MLFINLVNFAHCRNFLSHVIGQEISADAPLIHLHYKLTFVVPYNDRVFVDLFVVLC